MTIIPTEQLLTCDIDETLILWSTTIPTKTVWFNCPYSGDGMKVGVHEANVKILTNHIARGTTIIVWSKSGHLWAKAALKALGIDGNNLYVSCKPSGYIDDKPCQEWMGDQIYLPIDSTWGKSLTVTEKNTK